MEENNGEPKGGGTGELPVDEKIEKSEPAEKQDNETTESTKKPHAAVQSTTSKRNFKKRKASGIAKFRVKFASFGTAVKKLWDVWGRFKTKNTDEAKLEVESKTMGVPGFEEIACIEAEVPDIMMMDKDRVRTSCKECMRDPPTFPTKEQIKKKLIAVDKYYGVKSSKSTREQSDMALEHDADYYDADGTVVRPSWRFIMERPLVEQYVLMTNYIRKVSVLSEMKKDKPKMTFVEEEDSGSDTEYKKFEKKFIKEKKELLKKIQKPKTQDMAVQTSFKIDTREYLKESVSEISLYPESEESTNSPEPSAVTIVTSRDLSSPLQSDFDGRATDKTLSYREGNWWDPQTVDQTSYDSNNKNTSSSTDQSRPIQPQEFSNDSDSRIAPHTQKVEPATHKKPKDKKVSFSHVTYYQGPDKDAAVYALPKDYSGEICAKPGQQTMETIPQEKEITVPTKILQVNPPDNQLNEETTNENEHPDNNATETSKQNRKIKLENVLHDLKKDQTLSVSMPPYWHSERVLDDKQMLDVTVSRTPRVRQPSKKVHFQKFEELPDVDFSDTNVAFQEKADANIQAHVPEQKVHKNMNDKFKTSKHGEVLQKQQPNKQIPGSKVEPISLQIVQIRNQVNPHKESHLVDQEGTESIGTETIIQAAAPHILSAHSKPKSVRPGPKVSEHRMIPMVLSQQNHAAVEAQQTNLLKSNAQAQSKTLETKNVHCQAESNDTHSRSMKFIHVNESTHSDQKRFSPIPKTSNPPQRRIQQQSTDTEGSSTSNELLKLKPSPACFFKVATPTDLSKISVDEFYPDVPEIDAELSSLSETPHSSAPQVEIVFASKATALKYTQEVAFHNSARKEENTVMPIKVTGRLNDLSDKKTFRISPGVAIKIDKMDNSGTTKSHFKNISHEEKGEVTQTVNKAIKSSSLGNVEKITPSLRENPSVAVRSPPHETNENELAGCSEDRKEIPRHKPTLHTGEIEVMEEIGGEAAIEHVDDGMLVRNPEQLMEPENQLPMGRTKLYMRTLSSLEEEPSSVKETSSTQEKIIDMPIIVGSVDELKTIFEKKPSMSGESEAQVEDSCSDPKKITFPKDKHALAGQPENNEPTPTDASTKISISSQLTQKLDEKVSPKVAKWEIASVRVASDTIKPAKLENRCDSQSDNAKKPSVPILDDPSAQQWSQIDVIRASKIYSNTSMYFSSSEDRIAKLNKARAVFQPVTMDDDLEGSATRKSDGSNKTQGSSRSEPKENSTGMHNSESQPEKNLSSSSEQKQDGQIKANDGDNSVSEAHQSQAATNEKCEENHKPLEELPFTDKANLNEDVHHPLMKTKSLIDPTETKQWLMDAIPVLPRTMNSRSFRPHKLVCMKEVTEMEAVKFRQNAVKPVFRFLKRQREMKADE